MTISFTSKVIKYGDEYAVIIPDEICKSYDIKVGDELDLEIIKKVITLSKHSKRK
ncbi:MAG TPA: AbrB/MazE/SpoVT family DNA-binding domain-containing protein [Candidatus Saccharimonadales bacterium]|nr:AbrB/MazE/SpoVT family DNA-binding domain-containing protein [Candidatus Saccharimonadales bacterium]